MGLLDIYNDYMKRLQGISVEDDFTGMNYDLQVPKKDSEGKVINPMLRDREGGSPLTQPGGNLFPTKYVPQNQGQLTLGNTTINLPKSVLTKEAAAKAKQASILGKPTAIGQLAVSNSPFYNWLKERSLDKGIL